jgi:hypothetical protein
MTPVRRIVAEKRRLIYPLAVVLVLNAALFAAVVYPLSIKVGGAEETARLTATALAGAKRDFDSARATVTGKASADTELKKFYGAVLPPNEGAAGRITRLTIYQLAKAAGVSYERATREESHERDSGLQKLTTTIVLSGEYRDIRRFIHSLETAPEFLILENVALSQGTDESNDLNLTVRVATYYRTERNGV